MYKFHLRKHHQHQQHNKSQSYKKHNNLWMMEIMKNIRNIIMGWKRPRPGVSVKRGWWLNAQAQERINIFERSLGLICVFTMKKENFWFFVFDIDGCHSTLGTRLHFLPGTKRKPTQHTKKSIESWHVHEMENLSRCISLANVTLIFSLLGVVVIISVNNFVVILREVIELVFFYYYMLFILLVNEWGNVFGARILIEWSE